MPPPSRKRSGSSTSEPEKVKKRPRKSSFAPPKSPSDSYTPISQSLKKRVHLYVVANKKRRISLMLSHSSPNPPSSQSAHQAPPSTVLETSSSSSSASSSLSTNREETSSHTSAITAEIKPIEAVMDLPNAEVAQFYQPPEHKFSTQLFILAANLRGLRQSKPVSTPEPSTLPYRYQRMGKPEGYYHTHPVRRVSQPTEKYLDQVEAYFGSDAADDVIRTRGHKPGKVSSSALLPMKRKI